MKPLIDFFLILTLSLSIWYIPSVVAIDNIADFKPINYTYHPIENEGEIRSNKYTEQNKRYETHDNEMIQAAKDDIAYSLFTRDEIKLVQEKLSADGYYTSYIDGIVGPKTRSALKHFQASHKLEVTGEMDYETLSVMGFDYSKAGVYSE